MEINSLASSPLGNLIHHFIICLAIVRTRSKVLRRHQPHIKVPVSTVNLPIFYTCIIKNTHKMTCKNNGKNSAFVFVLNVWSVIS